MKTFCWIITLICSALGGILLFDTFLSADSAPQQAAGAAMAVAIVVIPYVFSRAIAELLGSKGEEQNERIIEILKKPSTDIETKARKYDESQVS